MTNSDSAMRITVVLAAALLLSSCAWVRHEIAPVAPPPLVSPQPKPSAPHKPHAPAAAVPAAMPAPQIASPAPDYETRCHAMAQNRADDAKGLGASTADQAKMQNDTYRDCMAQSVK